jgi:hypothetical protein
MIRRSFELVMNTEKNPFRSLPKMVRFQFMVILAYLWSAVFTIWAGSVMLLGPTVLGHSVLLVGIFFTADAFRWARSQAQLGARGHRDAMRNPRDGTVLHDDIWGAP